MRASPLPVTAFRGLIVFGVINMLEKLKSINHILFRLNNLEKSIVLFLAAILTFGGQLAHRQYEAIAWETKRDECQAMDDELDYEDPLFSFRLADFERCREEWYQMNYRGRVFD